MTTRVYFVESGGAEVQTVHGFEHPGDLAAHEVPAIAAQLESAGLPHCAVLAVTSEPELPSVVVRPLEDVALGTAHGYMWPWRFESSDGAARPVLEALGPTAVTPWFRPDWLTKLRVAAESLQGPIVAITQFRLRPDATTVRVLSDNGGLLEVTQSATSEVGLTELVGRYRPETVLADGAVAIRVDQNSVPVGEAQWARAFEPWCDLWRVTEAQSWPVLEEVGSHLESLAELLGLASDDIWFSLLRSAAVAAATILDARPTGMVNTALNPYLLRAPGHCTDWSGLARAPLGAGLTALVHLAPAHGVHGRDVIWRGAATAARRVAGSDGQPEVLRAGLLVGTISTAARLGALPERHREDRQLWARTWLDRAMRIR